MKTLSYATFNQDGEVVLNGAHLVPHRPDVTLNPLFAGRLSTRTALFVTQKGDEVTVVAQTPAAIGETKFSERLKLLRPVGTTIRIVAQASIELVRRDHMGVYRVHAAA